jgi:hypothetical protein
MPPNEYVGSGGSGRQTHFKRCMMANQRCARTETRPVRGSCQPHWLPGLFPLTLIVDCNALDSGFSLRTLERSGRINTKLCSIKWTNPQSRILMDLPAVSSPHPASTCRRRLFESAELKTLFMRACACVLERSARGFAASERCITDIYSGTMVSFTKHSVGHMLSKA